MEGRGAGMKILRFAKSYLLTLAVFIGAFAVATLFAAMLVVIGFYFGTGWIIALAALGFLISVGFASRSLP